MNSSHANAPTASAPQNTRFFLIFDELSKQETQAVDDVNTDEIDEIEQISRIVMQTTDDAPIFLTMT
jgi:hypothetical protein